MIHGVSEVKPIDLRSAVLCNKLEIGLDSWDIGPLYEKINSVSRKLIVIDSY